MIPNVVFATSTASVVVDGIPYILTAGEAWDDRSPVVLARPNLFSATPVRVRGRDGFDVVEEATAVPGAKRAARR